MNAITYRIMDTMDEMQKTESLQRIVWGMSGTDILSALTMRWMIHIGGLLLGAWDDDELVGFCIASPGKREGKWVLWSDMAGVHPDYQGQGIGYQLKIRQQSWAYGEGYGEVRWTFDPMRQGNATFNLHKLGVISYLYHPSFYGEMNDSINQGLPSDRLEVVWSTSPHTNHKPSLLSHFDATFVVEYSEYNIHTRQSEKEFVGIQIPYDLNKLKENNLPLAINWQKAVRENFIIYFQKGYQTIDFMKNDQFCWYILYKNKRY